LLPISYLISLLLSIPDMALPPGWIMPGIQFIFRLLGEKKGQQAQGAYEEILIDSTFDPMLKNLSSFTEGLKHGPLAAPVGALFIEFRR